MKLFGLTGGMGMGKSTAARILSERGIPIIDTDLLARELTEPGQPALEEIRREFGRELIDEQGRLRRDRLAETVFQDESARRKLEGILHPRIRERWLKETEAWRNRSRARGVVVIPLLFETNAERHFDAVICVACREDTQRERLRQRGWSDEHIRQRLEAQWPIQRKMDAADHVVWTEGVLEVHAEQLERIIAS